MLTETNNYMLSKGQEVEFFIEKLLYGGGGLAHFGSMACFVDDVIPGETVRAHVKTVKKQYATASLSSICEPSPHRIRPPCSLFRTCGGCQWQHIDYNFQLHWKKLIVGECIERLGGMRSVTVLEPFPSPAILQYRSRTNLKVSTSGNPVIGYYQRGTHRIIPVTYCPLLVSPLNKALSYCNNLCSENRNLLTDISEIQLLASSGNEVLISFYRDTSLKSWSTFSPDQTPDNSSNAASALSAYEHSCHDDIMGLSFIRSPLTFYQINREQNAAMITTVLKYLSPSGSQRILDLYCGCGNFSLFLAREGAHIVGIDSSSNAIAEANKNAAANQLYHCSYVCGDVEKTIKQIMPTHFHSVLINPPRRGCTPKTLEYINHISPRIIVYVSCNPATLARDLKQLMGYGYCIEAVQPVDMFPQTYHIETIIKLIKS